MIEAAEAVQSFIANRRRADLDSDRMLLFALARAIEIIGEAASKLSPEARAAMPSVPWRAWSPCATVWYTPTSISTARSCGRRRRRKFRHCSLFCKLP
jgi:hypothetical protein